MKKCTLIVALIVVSLVCPSNVLAEDDGAKLRQLEAKVKMLESTLEDRDATIATLETQVQEGQERIAALTAILEDAGVSEETLAEATDEAATICPVVRVIDGDTIVVSIDDEDVTVRLIGVDTPETKHPNKPVQAFGKEASAFTTNLLAGETVRLVIDPQQGETDRYGRALAYVYREPDGLFVNAELVRQGYGHAYTKYPFKYMADFQALELAARTAERGLWVAEDDDTSEQSQETPTAAPQDAPPPTEEVAPETATEQEAVTVYVTRTGTKYHRGSCSYLRQSKIATTLSDARASYGPCSRCKPPR